MSKSVEGAPTPAALGVIWKIAAALGLPALGAALMLWRDSALHEQDIAALRVQLAAISGVLHDHLDADGQRVTNAARDAQSDAVARAKLEAALDAVKEQINVVLTVLQRRRPG